LANRGAGFRRGQTGGAQSQHAEEVEMKYLIMILKKSGILEGEIDDHIVRLSMVVMFFFFGYQKWFDYEAQVLIPFISNRPLIFWLYPLLGVHGATYFLGAAEWTFGALLLLGFWERRLGLLGAIGSTFTFVATVTIIPFMPNGWAESAGGFPAMVGNVAFLMKDIVLLAASLYLVRHDALRVASGLDAVHPVSLMAQSRKVRSSG
jgi:uncharacterized membrane protein YkgB